ncbi:hypothetical protein M427DRAFT_223664 [Gonapodya prolifera JEL478]|uniref:Myb-like domain-containing protein n=1 Tax=Gonapodya prolifera (strain JEL478) TaxID=1344416 RepID=A0A139ANH1_GONPJ|nr:hypothetical protein M427DRAFT_223664 [Gonapodya prolifera JEL478]|eukprot:KXS18184.1 hypothetical protein M427DRAFT_223664 [Gonapodya prolifera JEL478]
MEPDAGTTFNSRCFRSNAPYAYSRNPTNPIRNDGFPTPPPGFPTPPPGFLGGSMGYPLPPPPGMPLPPAPTDGYPARHTPSQRPPPSVMSYEPSAPVEYTPTTGTQVRAKTADEKRVFWESRVRRGVVREDPSSFPHEPPFSSTETTPKQHVVSYRQWTSSDDAELEASLSKNGVPSRGSGPRVDGWYYSALATWDEVAADVPGRTAMECRFRFMTKTRWKGVGGQGAEESNVVESPKPEE